MIEKKDPPRAPRGSNETAQIVRMSTDLAERVKKAAKREGISLAEWWRTAAEAALASGDR